LNIQFSIFFPTFITYGLCSLYNPITQLRLSIYTLIIHHYITHTHQISVQFLKISPNSPYSHNYIFQHIHDNMLNTHSIKHSTSFKISKVSISNHIHYHIITQNPTFQLFPNTYNMNIFTQKNLSYIKLHNTKTSNKHTIP
jgi:hypothetical protein